MCTFDERIAWRGEGRTPGHVLLCATATDTTLTLLLSTTALALQATTPDTLSACCARLTIFQLTRIRAARISTSADQIGILVGHVIRLNLEGFALPRCRAVVTTWARRWTAIGILATVARARGVAAGRAIHP